MTSNRLDARLAKLEREGQAGSTIHAWQETGETTDEALARLCPAGVPAGVAVVFYAWSTHSVPDRRLVLPVNEP